MTPYSLRRLGQYAAALAVGAMGASLAYGGGWYAAHRRVWRSGWRGGKGFGV